MPAEALVDSNEWRRTRFYTRDMAELLTQHMPLLQAVHKVYKAKVGLGRAGLGDQGGGMTVSQPHVFAP